MKRVATIAAHLAAATPCDGGDREDRVSVNRLAANSGAASQVSKGTKSFTKSDILKQRAGGRCWIVIHENVYDVTDFLQEQCVLV